MRVAIAGGTGTLGRRVAAELGARGHEVRVLSRSSAEHPVDLRTGEGLVEALKGCDVVVDAVNDSGPAKRARQTLVEGARRLLEAEKAVGVGHHVCVSIVGCDRVPMGYYRVKTEQEEVVRAAPVGWTIVRATQFHELVATVFGAVARSRILPLPKVALQSVACADVATAVADVAEGPVLRREVRVAGPEIEDVRDAARTWRSVTGRRAALMPVPLPGKLGRALRGGALTTDAPDHRGTKTFADWMKER